jgi:hypothetical protein
VAAQRFVQQVCVVPDPQTHWAQHKRLNAACLQALHDGVERVGLSAARTSDNQVGGSVATG